LPNGFSGVSTLGFLQGSKRNEITKVRGEDPEFISSIFCGNHREPASKFEIGNLMEISDSFWPKVRETSVV
jgi:hypothetical protein